MRDETKYQVTLVYRAEIEETFYVKAENPALALDKARSGRGAKCTGIKTTMQDEMVFLCRVKTAD